MKPVSLSPTLSPLGEGGLVAKDVRVTHGRVEAVRGVSLQINARESVGLIGESGSGKSSLARALLGLEPLTGGTVTFDGQAMHGAGRSLRRRVQPVFQDVGAALDPRMRIRQSLSEPFDIHRVDFDESTLKALLSRVQLDAALLDRLPRELSVGQRQRVNIARALALEPELLILDEPVSALDVSVQAEIINILRGLDVAMLVITHDLEVVTHLCSRLLVMKDGVIVDQGILPEVLQNPVHPYTRELTVSRFGA